MNIPPRYVRRDRRVYPFSLCKACGVAGLTDADGGRTKIVCSPTTCLACGTTQCLSNGGGNGRCFICFYGYLPGWSQRQQSCRYSGCTEPVVARAGAWPVCKNHLERRKPGYTSDRLAERDKTWILCEAV